MEGKWMGHAWKDGKELYIDFRGYSFPLRSSIGIGF
jgi:hypothetical protein